MPRSRVASFVESNLCSSKSCKFEQIMGRADQHPFLFDLVQPAQQELPEPACLLDLPKHRLARLLAQPIRAVIALAGNLLGHGGEPAALLGFPCSRRRGAVLLPASRDKPVDLTFLQTLQIGVRGVAGIGRYLLWQDLSVSLDLVH